ncbi:MAG: DUF6588 family protein [Bdellovibrionia bacterium]
MKLILVLTTLFATSFAHGQSFEFNQLDQSDLDSIAREFSANFTHSTVSGASSLGDVWGFELALIGGVTKIPETEKRVKEVDASANTPQLANAVLGVQVSVPYGITGELTFFPAVGSESFKYSNLGLGVKWTLTQGFLELPVDVAAKLNFTSTALTFTQEINNASTGNVPVDAKVDYKNTIMNVGAFVSKKFVLIEPYFGLGIVSAKADMGVQGTGTIFDSTYTNGQTGSSSPTGTMITVGADLSLLVLKLGFEYSSLFGTSRMLGKLALAF